MNLVETSLFDVRLVSSDTSSATKFVLSSAASGVSGYVCVANVDMVTRARRDSKLLSIMCQATTVVTDGLPLVWALKAKGLKDSERVYGPGLMLSLCAQAAQDKMPIFLYGGTAHELGLLQVALLRRFPALIIAGAISPPLLPADPPFDAATMQTINGSGARLIFVGLGCPKQEYWMNTHAPQLHCLAIGVGLAFAQIAGTKAAAPVWMQHNGLEWLFRLIQEPRRLWARYLVGNSLFVWYCIKAVVVAKVKRR